MPSTGRRAYRRFRLSNSSEQFSGLIPDSITPRNSEHQHVQSFRNIGAYLPASLPSPVADHLPVPVVDRGLDVVRVVAVVAVPQQHPDGAEQVGLRQLHNDGARAQLVARVALVPVVVARVAVQQRVARTTVRR